MFYKSHNKLFIEVVVQGWTRRAWLNNIFIPKSNKTRLLSVICINVTGKISCLFIQNSLTSFLNLQFCQNYHKKYWYIYFLLHFFGFRVCFMGFVGHTVDNIMWGGRCDGDEETCGFCQISLIKWGVSSELVHIGLGKSFLGSFTWSERVSEGHATLEMMFSSAMWGVPNCSISQFFMILHRLLKHFLPHGCFIDISVFLCFEYLLGFKDTITNNNHWIFQIRSCSSF